MKIKSHLPVQSALTLSVLSALLLIATLPISGFSPVPDLDGETAALAENGKATYQVQTEPQETLTDQIIVKYKPDTVASNLGVQVDQMERLSSLTGITLEYIREMSDDAHVLRLPKRLPLEQVQAIASQLMTLPEVEYAEPDQILYHTLVPNDPQYTNQWHYFENWGINLPAAWDITIGSSSIVVAVVDSGITNHADLSGRTVAGYDFISDSLVANDGNGRDNDPSDPGDWITAAESSSGYFIGCPVSNSSWHGTHTAGTIGAASNNGLGVTGVNWNSKILPVRVLGKCGGYTSDVVDGVRWAAGLTVTGVPENANPAKVINLSLSGPGSCNSTWQGTIDAVTSAGAVVVVAAGNSNANASNYSPASCSGVITVAATDRNGSRAYYSNYGTSVEISAPGGAQSYTNDPQGILSTVDSGTTVPVSDSYAYYQGTSMAAPHVSGVASLLFSIDPTLPPSRVLEILQSTAKAFPSGSTCNISICGSGIVDAGAAVASLEKPPGLFAKSEPANGATSQSTGPTLSWGTSDGGNSYEYCYDTTNDNTCSIWIGNGSSTSKTLSGLSLNTTYYWQVRAINTFGTTYANGSSTAFWSFTTTASAPGAGIYDDMHGNWSYVGSWAMGSGFGGAHDGTLHYTGTVGDTASFTFSGTQFILTYTRDVNRGDIGVYVDGGLVTTIDATGAFQWQDVYISPSYTSGTHLVQFTHAGGAYIDIDSIEIKN